MRRLAFVLVGFLAFVAGCAGVEIPAGEAPKMEAGEGLLVAYVDVGTLLYAHVASQADAYGSFSINGIEPGGNVKVYHLPAGRYCVQQLTFHANTFRFGRGMCFGITANKATMIGIKDRDKIVESVEEEVARAEVVKLRPELTETSSTSTYYYVPKETIDLNDTSKFSVGL